MASKKCVHVSGQWLWGLAKNGPKHVLAKSGASARVCLHIGSNIRAGGHPVAPRWNHIAASIRFDATSECCITARKQVQATKSSAAFIKSSWLILFNQTKQLVYTQKKKTSPLVCLWDESFHWELQLALTKLPSLGSMASTSTTFTIDFVRGTQYCFTRRKKTCVWHQAGVTFTVSCFGHSQYRCSLEASSMFKGTACSLRCKMLPNTIWRVTPATVTSNTKRMQIMVRLWPPFHSSFTFWTSAFGACQCASLTCFFCFFATTECSRPLTLISGLWSTPDYKPHYYIFKGTKHFVHT